MHIVFYDCSNIEFKDENMETIWSTSGTGEVASLPPRVGIYIREGAFGAYAQDGSFQIGP